jgi:hypothetical protein
VRGKLPPDPSRAIGSSSSTAAQTGTDRARTRPIAASSSPSRPKVDGSAASGKPVSNCSNSGPYVLGSTSVAAMNRNASPCA